jgi:type I restriction enzyme, S subunit
MSTELPHGWALAPLGDLLQRIEAGKSPRCDTRPAGPEEVGVLKTSAMSYGTFRAKENMALLKDATWDERHLIRPGDLLLCRANSPEYVGSAVLVPQQFDGRLLLSDKSLRLVPAPGLDATWLMRMLRSPGVRRAILDASSGTKEGMRNISQAGLRALRVPVPPERLQRRIASALDAALPLHFHLSHGLTAFRRKLEVLDRSFVAAALNGSLGGGVGPATDWHWATVGDVGRVQLGRQRAPKYHAGPNMKAYLRVANVFEDRIDVTDVMSMQFDVEEFETYRLHAGDILLNEGQSPQLLGRPAMYRGELAEAAFTNSLIRFGCGSSGVTAGA